MAWKNHQRPATKKCTSCLLDKPFDEAHFRFTSRNRRGKTFRYADSMCIPCRREWDSEMRKIKRQQRNPHLRGHGIDPGGDLRRAINLVLYQHVSQREAVRLTNVSRSKLRQALADIPGPRAVTKHGSGRGSRRRHIAETAHGSAPLVPALPVLKELRFQALLHEITQRELVERAGLSHHLLQEARDSGKILAADVDTLFVSVGRPDLAHLLTEN